ncbi:hypothetical protein BJY01DRAFT_249024 [Aspergillus pseudoustus]|uniref:Extracellular membrane protein CFEM domain-containing protein n=1 Tax=Aspergillus pseudoustus TaxID=1810923 RepID=A0ABR4JR82_9EURO
MVSRLANLSALAALCASTAGAATADAITASSEGCVDSSSMKTCVTNAEGALGECGQDAQGDIQLQGCILTYDMTLLGCYIESCWNKVYSCEYQLVVVDILSQQYPPPEDPVPFWPAPDNAPGGCVCNFGTIWDNLSSSLNQLTSTCNEYMSSVSSLQSCQCCAWSSGLSAFYGACPGYDLSNYGLAAIASTAATTLSMSGTCSDLTSSVCKGKFGIESQDNGVYPDPANLSDPGSKSLTTTQGSGPLTTFPGGETVIAGTFLNMPYTLTAASYNADNVEETGSSTPTDSSEEDSTTGSSTSSTSTAGADSSDSSSSDSTNHNSAFRYGPLTMGMAGVITLALVVISL